MRNLNWGTLYATKRGVMVTENGPKYAYRVIYTFLIHFMLHEILKNLIFFQKQENFKVTPSF